MSNLQAALKLAERGLRVFPCWQNRKTPIYKRWQIEATTDPEIINAWWSSYAMANLAVTTGAMSGVFVVDIDVKGDKNGETDLAELEAKHGRLPLTVESITPSGGRHLWFRMPPHTVRNSMGNIAAGIDVRGDGGYVLVPPSQIDGAAYVWSVDSGDEFADAPEWLIPSAEVTQLHTRKPIEYWQQISRGVSDGSRHKSAASLAGYLLYRGIDPQTTLELVLGWNLRCNPPEDENLVVLHVESLIEKEAERRKGRL